MAADPELAAKLNANPGYQSALQDAESESWDEPGIDGTAMIEAASERRREAGTAPDWGARFAAALEDLNRQLPALLALIDRHQPGPLCIDGHEYHRRQQARKKRRRRRGR